MRQAVTPREHNIPTPWRDVRQKRNPASSHARSTVMLHLTYTSSRLSCVWACAGAKCSRYRVDRVTAEVGLASLSPPQQCVRSGLFYTRLLLIQHWVIAAPSLLVTTCSTRWGTRRAMQLKRETSLRDWRWRGEKGTVTPKSKGVWDVRHTLTNGLFKQKLDLKRWPWSGWTKAKITNQKLSRPRGNKAQLTKPRETHDTI